jgi:hypothetical protein
MISDLELVHACAATYADPPTLPIPMTGVDCRTTPASDGGVIVAFRGSVTLEDWVRDFMALPIVGEHPQLGRCHAGFLDAAQSIVAAIAAAVAGRPFYVTGHSLGGAVAQGVGALLRWEGHEPARIVTFGSPRFGMEQFAAWLFPLDVRLYRRGNDVVPLVPFDAPGFDFLDARKLIPIGKPQRNPFDCHHIDGYVADVGAYLQSGAAAAAA